MKILNKTLLEDYCIGDPTSRKALGRWVDIVSTINGADKPESENPRWANFGDVRGTFNSASHIKGHVVFNIKGNDFRLDTVISYTTGVIKIVRIGTHWEYDNWDF